MKKSNFLILSIVAIVSLMVFSCSKDTPAPTAEIFATINGYEVNFNPTVTDVDTYIWNFGDGESSTEAKPVHTYALSGTYHVSLTVNGGGGEATVTKDITIAASFLEMLTGGETVVDGKTWVLSTAYTAGTDGGGPITPEMPLTIPSADNVLEMFGLEAEYDNEFTFYADGHYKMDLKNGVALAGAVYGVVIGTIQGEPAYDIGMCAATYSVPSSATWELHETDLTVDAITDPNTTDIPPVHGDVTFTDEKWISLSEGAYFGILDFPTTAKFIIKEITPTKMSVALFLCGYGYGENPDDMMLPTNFIHITFVPKSAK